MQTITQIYTDLFCSFFLFLLCALTTFVVLFLCSSLPLLRKARSIKETYAAVGEANIYFFLASHSSHTRAFVRLLVEETGRWRCIGSDRRRGERAKVVFLFKNVRTHTQH
jgi:hypothetical protein